MTQSSGFFSVRSTCPQCRGQGSVITQPCPECRGTGRTRIAKTVQLKIPAGVETGSRLRLRGEGESGDPGGPAGDLYVFIYVEPHEFFERNDDDLYCRVPISFVKPRWGGGADAQRKRKAEDSRELERQDVPSQGKNSPPGFRPWRPDHRNRRRHSDEPHPQAEELLGSSRASAP